jgi:phage-related minor tail protein
MSPQPSRESSGPKMKPGHVCPECGTTGWETRDYQRVLQDLRNARSDLERLARDNGLLTYQLAAAKAKTKEETSWLMSKVDKQRRVIARLERRWRETIGAGPYEGAEASEGPR